MLNSSAFQVSSRCGPNAHMSCCDPFIYATQSPDTKKEEFRRYLERSGVIDALTKGEVALKSPPPTRGSRQ